MSRARRLTLSRAGENRSYSLNEDFGGTVAYESEAGYFLGPSPTLFGTPLPTYTERGSSGLGTNVEFASHTSRTIVLNIVIIPNDTRDMESALSELLRFLDPVANSAPVTLTWRRQGPNGRVKRSIDGYMVLGSEAVAIEYGESPSVRLSLAFLCPNPYWRGKEQSFDYPTTYLGINAAGGATPEDEHIHEGFYSLSNIPAMSSDMYGFYFTLRAGSSITNLVFEDQRGGNNTLFNEYASYINVLTVTGLPDDPVVILTDPSEIGVYRDLKQEIALGAFHSDPIKGWPKADGFIDPRSSLMFVEPFPTDRVKRASFDVESRLSVEIQASSSEVSLELIYSPLYLTC